MCRILYRCTVRMAMSIKIVVKKRQQDVLVCSLVFISEHTSSSSLCFTIFPGMCQAWTQTNTERTSGKETFPFKLPWYCNIPFLHYYDMFFNIKETDNKPNEHRHLMIESCHSVYLKSTWYYTSDKQLQFRRRMHVNPYCTTCHFLQRRNVEGKKAPSPSLLGEPYGLSSPQLMSS